MAVLIPGAGVVSNTTNMLIPGAGAVEGEAASVAVTATLIYNWIWSIYDTLRKRHAN